jgi:hypothetical protein
MKEKQIEEMAECCPFFWNGACTGDGANTTDCDFMCKMFGFMTSLLNAGYRKQIEGEWVHSDKAKHWLGKDECNKCHYHTHDREDLSHFNFCPNCGAKMKGEGK